MGQQGQTQEPASDRSVRLGVSGKIFVAYTALATVFIASSGVYLLYMHRARERVVASQALFDIQSDLDAAWRKLRDFPMKTTRRPDPTRSLLFVQAGKLLDAALATTDRYLAGRHNPPGGPDLAAYRTKMGEVGGELGQTFKRLGAFEASEDEREREAFATRLANLTAATDRLKRSIRGEAQRMAAELRADEELAGSMAILLAVVGLVVAVLVALSMMRTLRPLHVLRQRARAVAGGDYARRVDVRSRDEIGDLAREFDAMAVAIQERERRLIQTERLATIGRMAAQITHEIRNPLASIGLNAELLVDETSPGDLEARRLVAAIAREVDRLSEITDSYLRFVRLPRSKKEPEDLGALVSSMLAFSRAELERAGVTLDLHIEPGLPEVMADEAQIRQSLLNLVRNAREAMPEGGTLTVRVMSRGAHEIEIGIADTGSGIAPEDVARIFDPFFSTKEKGTGLGLALVQQIVVEHGGRIEVRPHEGGGSLFAVVLPVHESPIDVGTPSGEPEVKAATAGAAPEPVPASEAVAETPARVVAGT
jgi:signal transduction histidine kinase